MNEIQEMAREYNAQTIVNQLMAVQSELKVPKGQFNQFGKYKYRSCEDILEAVKPLLSKHGLICTIRDEIVMVGDRYYIRATAEVMNQEGEALSNTAYARESLEKKGMDDSQITGTASSYARKYAMNGLFLIDDTKDADTNEYATQTTPTGYQREKEKREKTKSEKISAKEVEVLKGVCKRKGLDVDTTFPDGVENLTGEQYAKAAKKLGALPDKEIA